jgi:uncharacterized protein (TIGR03437 family)
MGPRFILPAILLATLSTARAAEVDALAISKNIQNRHFPNSTLLDPIFDSPTGDQIVSYTRCGDSALFTGLYLAAESFRYNVTHSPDALANLNAALAGLQALSDVTGDNRLARCMVLANAPYAGDIASEEARNTVHQNPPWIWVDNTSRDEIVGAFFGLSAAYDLVDDATVRKAAGALATRLMGFIADHQWSPNDDISNTFLLRPEQLQALLQVTRHVDPSNTISGPFIVPPIDIAVLFDVQSNGSYFKFNLDYLSFYNLVRLQNNSDNRGAYQIVRDYTASHENAFFDIIDRALNGQNAARDQEMCGLLDQWLQRSRRDQYVDLSKTVPVCGSEACQPVPVSLRTSTDFLWQRDPFQLTGGGKGLLENAGIDYILPYWMARYYGVIAPDNLREGSAASYAPTLAPDGITSVFGLALPDVNAVTVIVKDSASVSRPATLYFASAGQVNFIVPSGTAAGTASITIQSPGAPDTILSAEIDTVAPGLFSADATGHGAAAATAIRVIMGGPASAIPVFSCSGPVCATVPIDLGLDTPVYLSLYGTGIRHRSSLANVTCTIGGVSVPVLYAGPQTVYAGLDQVNVPLPLSLRGMGEADLVVTVDGQPSNAVRVNIQ